jgi:hypothetical protein
MLPSFASQTVTILNPGTRVEWGQQVEDWTSPVETVETCVWYSLSGIETTGGREAEHGADVEVHRVAAGGRQVFLDPASTCTARSRIRFPDGGRDWEVIGEPSVFESPLGGLDHLEVLCKRWEGDQ